LLHSCHAQLLRVSSGRATASIGGNSAQGQAVRSAAGPIEQNCGAGCDPLKFNVDGSLDVYLQHADPGGDKSAN
jgi:hypothetical protein